MNNSLLSDLSHKTGSAIFKAILAAVLYGISSPVSKVLITKIPPTMMAACLYLGAGIGMFLLNGFLKKVHKESTEAQITRKELPYVVGMIILDILAPIFLMFGLLMTNAANVSLLNNFEIVATSLIAMFAFKESIDRRMWLAIILITISSFILSFDAINEISFSIGSVLVIMACICWGLENNCTRMLSIKDPKQIVVIKGIGSGIGALIISVAIQEYSTDLLYISIALILGFVAYGLSIFFYISAQRELGAARTSTYYAAAPFVGVFASWLFLKEMPSLTFLLALAIMLTGTYFAISEKHGHKHHHHEEEHEHKHDHKDGHHNHAHEYDVDEHSHPHTHEELEHEHDHTPDLHHRHSH
jgi:drug/metabolite transporter (DMT)-like permease